MAIPDFQSVMLPFLKIASDEQEHHIRAVLNDLSDQFGLTEDEKKELLPSGVATVMESRVGWARTYLRKAGLIDYSKRGYFRITDRGKSVLAQKPSKIDVAFLRRYPEFIEFLSPRRMLPVHRRPNWSPRRTPLKLRRNSLLPAM
jgi:restriction system protein